MLQCYSKEFQRLWVLVWIMKEYVEGLFSLRQGPILGNQE